MAVIKRLCIFICFAFISSCSSQSDESKLSKIIDLYKNSNKQKEIKTFKRNELINVGYPLVEVRSNGIIKQLLMLPITTRLRSANLISGSGQSMTMYGSFIIRTFGMNLNLISVNLDKNSQFVIKKPIENWIENSERAYTFLEPSQKSKVLKYKCSIEIEKETKIIIVEKTHNTFLIVESCRNKYDTFRNLYWAEKDGLIVKSKQWMPNKETYLEVSIIIPIDSYME